MMTQADGKMDDGHLSRMDRWVAMYPQLPYIAPFFTFLILMSLSSVLPGPRYLPWLYALRTFGAGAMCVVFWRYFPRLGRAHIPWAILFGVATAGMWVGVHRWFAGQSWYPVTQVLGRDAEPSTFYDCFEQLGRGWGLWLFLVVRIGGASVVVPIIEEIFWRGFVLRILIDYWEWDKVPLGMYTLRSFVVCSLLSAGEHPMWEVGILCWVIYNLLFYWKKSLLFLIVTHGVTNFALYAWVVWQHDWVFWS